MDLERMFFSPNYEPHPKQVAFHLATASPEQMQDDLRLVAEAMRTQRYGETIHEAIERVRRERQA